MDGHPNRLTGLRKASMLLMSLEPSVSARVIEQLSQEERTLLGLDIARVRQLSSQDRDAAMQRFGRYLRGEDDRDVTPAAPVDTVRTPQPAAEAFGWLETQEVRDVARVLGSEQPQYAALVLSGLPARTVSAVLSCMSADAQDRITSLMAGLGPVSGETLEAVEKSLRAKLTVRPVPAAALSRASRPRTFVAAAHHVLSIARQALAGLMPVRRKETEGGLAGLSDAQIRSILRRVGLHDLCLALKASSDRERSVLLRNLEPDARAFVERRLSDDGRVAVAEVLGARERISDLAGRLAAGGAV